MQTQIKAFGSMFLEMPHRVTSYFGGVVKQNIEVDSPTIFNPEHKFSPYYTSALAYYRLDAFFRTKALDSKYRKVKFFLLLLFRKLVSPENLPQNHMTSERQSERYCQPIIEILNDREKALSYFTRATEIVDQSPVVLEDKKALKNASTTKDLLDTWSKSHATSP